MKGGGDSPSGSRGGDAPPWLRGQLSKATFLCGALPPWLRDEASLNYWGTRCQRRSIKGKFVKVEISLSGFWSKSVLENRGFFGGFFGGFFPSFFPRKWPEKIHQEIHRGNQTPKSTKNFREGASLKVWGFGPPLLNCDALDGQGLLRLPVPLSVPPLLVGLHLPQYAQGHPQSTDMLNRQDPGRTRLKSNQWVEQEWKLQHFYFSHRPSPLKNSTLRSNTLQGVDFGSILGHFLVNFGQKRPKTDRKPTQNWPSPGTRQASTPKRKRGSVAEIKVLMKPWKDLQILRAPFATCNSFVRGFFDSLILTLEKTIFFFFAAFRFVFFSIRTRLWEISIPPSVNC